MKKKLVNKFLFGLFLNILLLVLMTYVNSIDSLYAKDNNFYILFYGLFLMPIHIVICLIMLLFISYKLSTVDTNTTFSTRDKVLIFIYYISVLSIFLFFYII